MNTKIKHCVLMGIILNVGFLSGCDSTEDGSAAKTQLADQTTSKKVTHKPNAIAWQQYDDGDDLVEDMNNLITNRLYNDAQYLYFSFDNKGEIARWHRHEIYFSISGQSTTIQALPGGASALLGLQASKAFRFMRTDNNKWVIEKYNSKPGPQEGWESLQYSNAVLSVVVDSANQIKGRIPLQELDSPTPGSTIQVKFVSTGEGWGTDQSPDTGMGKYTVL